MAQASLRVRNCLYVGMLMIRFDTFTDRNKGLTTVATESPVLEGSTKLTSCCKKVAHPQDEKEKKMKGTEDQEASLVTVWQCQLFQRQAYCLRIVASS